MPLRMFVCTYLCTNINNVCLYARYVSASSSFASSSTPQLRENGRLSIPLFRTVLVSACILHFLHATKSNEQTDSLTAAVCVNNTLTDSYSWQQFATPGYLWLLKQSSLRPLPSRDTAQSTVVLRHFSCVSIVRLKMRICQLHEGDAEDEP